VIGDGAEWIWNIADDHFPGAVQSHGYVVIPAEDGLATLQICRQREGPIHLALLDIMVPGMKGPQLRW
jgi:CheY-like chemotaxis protein